MRIWEVDDDSARSSPPDCELYLHPITKGTILRDVDIDDLQPIAPLIYKLDIPVDVFIPTTVPEDQRRTFVRRVLARISREFEISIWRAHRQAQQNNACFFASLLDVFGTIPLTLSLHAKITWKLYGFECHAKEIGFLCGADNLMYINMSRRLDELEKSGDIEYKSGLQS